MIKIEQGKKYLVTGGAGFLGGELIERILNQGGYVNGNGVTFASWNWKANAGTTSSNTDGSITSTVQANICLNC